VPKTEGYESHHTIETINSNLLKKTKNREVIRDLIVRNKNKRVFLFGQRKGLETENESPYPRPSKLDVNNFSSPSYKRRNVN
jgi:hypothetical protein